MRIKILRLGHGNFDGGVVEHICPTIVANVYFLYYNLLIECDEDCLDTDEGTE